MQSAEKAEEDSKAQGKKKVVSLPPTARLFTPTQFGTWCKANNQPFFEIGTSRPLLETIIPIIARGGKGKTDVRQYMRAAMFAGRTIDAAAVPPNGLICTADHAFIYEGLGYRDDDPRGSLHQYFIGKDAKSRFAIDLVTPQMPSVSEECIFFGGHKNFGHFIFQYLLRLSALAWVPNLQSLPIAVYDSLPRRYLDFLEICGFPAERRITISTDVPTHFEKAWFISNPLRRDRDSNVSVWPEALWGLRHMTAHLARPLNQARPRRFIPRSDANWRRLANERDVLNSLKPYGIEPVDLSEMSAADQIGAVSNAEILVTVVGAASTITVFAPPDCAIIELAPPDLVGSFNSVCYADVLGQPFERVEGLALSADESVAAGLSAPTSHHVIDKDFNIDTETLNTFLVAADEYCKRKLSS